ncbi:hypothetical protein C0J52_24478 [Blattella germanica]|nr:hypothetical protein C0J52_24478 [Blattella germanica]
MRASEQRTVKKIFKTMPEGTRKIGMPKTRWEDCVRKDVRILEIQNWRRTALDRQKWWYFLKVDPT